MQDLNAIYKLLNLFLISKVIQDNSGIRSSGKMHLHYFETTTTTKLSYTNKIKFPSPKIPQFQKILKKFKFSITELIIRIR